MFLIFFYFCRETKAKKLSLLFADRHDHHHGRHTHTHAAVDCCSGDGGEELLVVVEAVAW